METSNPCQRKEVGVSTGERIRLLWADQLGLARGKYLPARSAQGATNHCVGVFSQQFDRSTPYAPSTGFEEGFPDIEARFESADIRPGWERSTSVVVADLFRDDRPLEIAPRLALRRAVDAWQSMD